MIKTIDKGFTDKFTRDGSHLKFCRAQGGGGAAAITVGGLIAAIVVVLGLAVKDIMPPENFIIFMVCGVGLGILLIVLGIMMKKKRVSGYLEYFSRKNNYTIEEIEMLDREIASSDSVVIVEKSKVDAQSLLSGIIITKNWIKMPSNTAVVSRMVDMAAVWFDPRPVYMGQEAAPQVCFLDSQGNVNFLASKEAFGLEVVSEAAKRNPNLITSKIFEYEGAEYNCLNQPKEVAGVYRKAVSR